MHPRRLAAFFLGAWLAGSLFMTMVATHNFRAVDEMLGTPSAPAAKIIKALGHDSARAFLRYQASELNRRYFEGWEWVQIALGTVLFLVLMGGFRRLRSVLLLSGVMLLIVVGMRFYLTPAIIHLGRAIDFVPAGQALPERNLFWTFHNAYSAAEVLKLIAGVALLVLLVRRSRTQPEVHPQPGKTRWVRAR